jgi:hypothetical protein
MKKLVIAAAPSCWGQAKRGRKCEARGRTYAGVIFGFTTLRRSSPKTIAKPMPCRAHSIRRAGVAGECLRCAMIGAAMQHMDAGSEERSSSAGTATGN